MNKETQLAAADALAQDINGKHAAIMQKVDHVKSQAAEIGALANEVGMALTSARDTVGDSFHHWLREKIEMPTVTVERYIRHHKHYHPGQLFLPGFKPVEDRASVTAQADANAETAEGDTPKKDEHEDISVRDIAAGWVYDARRWFSQLIAKMPPDQMNEQQIKDTLQVVRPVRDAIYAYEQRLLALTRGEA